MDPISLAAIGAAASAAIPSATTLAATSLATTAVGAGVSAYGAAKTADANAAMYRYQAGVASVNQQIAKQNQDYALNVGQVQAKQAGMKTRQQIGQTKVAQAASNLDVNSGSPLLVRESEQELGQYDQAMIRSDAAKRAYGYGIESMQAGVQSKVFQSASSQAKIAGGINVATSILGGATSVSSKWLQASKEGIFS